tara:strand:- start:203 stop:439 length:237 start_codon:yes stop_codon:yes gene_type:complete
MALKKELTYDYEIRGVFKVVQQREKVTILEDGNELSSSYSRKSFMPNADISGESDECKAICNAVWTDEIKKAYEDSLK